MWFVISAFVCPAAIFSLCGFAAWIRMWHIGRRREQKVFDELEDRVRQRIEDHRKNMFEENCDNYSRDSSVPMIKVNESDIHLDQRPSILLV